MPEATTATAAETPGGKDEAAASLWTVLRFYVLALAVAGGVLVYLVAVVGASLDAPTFALSAACGALLIALRELFGMVTALARPPVETILAEEAGTLGTVGSLRDEKRRVLKAIKELEFDHDMGKLSDADFEEIGGKYRMRAIELMRRLDGGEQLHPELRALLDGHDGGEDSAGDTEGAGAVVTCGACEGENTADSKFCRHCGAEIQATPAAEDLETESEAAEGGEA